MSDSWIPYFFLAVVVLLVISCVFAYRHKEEILEAAGIDIPGIKDKPKHKAKQRGRMNTKRGGKAQAARLRNENQVINRNSQQQKQAPKANIPQQQKGKQGNQDENEEEESRLSDVPISTKDTALSAMIINNIGTLMICQGKDRHTFLFAINSLDYGLYPLNQYFELDPTCDIVALCSFHYDNNFNVVYANDKTKCLLSKSITFDEEAKPIVSDFDFRVNNAYVKNIQKIVSTPNSKYVVSLVDHSTLNFYNHKGNLVHTQDFKNKRCNDFATLEDFSKIAISSNNEIFVYRYLETPMVSLELDSTVKVNATVISLSYSEKTHQLVAASSDGLIYVFKDPPDSGIAFRFNCTNVKLVRASPKTDFLAIISQKAVLQVVDMSTGVPYSQLNNVHDGEVHFAEFSKNGSWFFVGSKQKPNIQTFCFNTEDEKKK